MLAAVLGGVLVVVAIVAGLKVRADAKRAADQDAEIATLRADVNLLKAQASALEPYRELVQGAPDWVWAADENGTITLSNPAGAVLLGRDDLVGCKLAELTHSEDGATGFNGVVRRLHADGSQRTV